MFQRARYCTGIPEHLPEYGQQGIVVPTETEQTDSSPGEDQGGPQFMVREEQF